MKDILPLFERVNPKDAACRFKAELKRLDRQIRNGKDWRQSCLGKLDAYLLIVYGKSVYAKLHHDDSIVVVWGDNHYKNYNTGLTMFTYLELRDQYKQMISAITDAYNKKEEEYYRQIWNSYKKRA